MSHVISFGHLCCPEDNVKLPAKVFITLVSGIDHSLHSSPLTHPFYAEISSTCFEFPKYPVCAPSPVLFHALLCLEYPSFILFAGKFLFIFQDSIKMSHSI